LINAENLWHILDVSYIYNITRKFVLLDNVCWESEVCAEELAPRIFQEMPFVRRKEKQEEPQALPSLADAVNMNPLFELQTVSDFVSPLKSAARICKRRDRYLAMRSRMML